MGCSCGGKGKAKERVSRGEILERKSQVRKTRIENSRQSRQRSVPPGRNSNDNKQPKNGLYRFERETVEFEKKQKRKISKSEIAEAQATHSKRPPNYKTYGKRFNKEREVGKPTVH